MKIKSIAPWFGGKRTLAPEIVAELGPHTQYFEPFCGSMAVLLAKPPSQKETVNDLHDDLINLARTLRELDLAEDLYEKLSGTLFSEGLLHQAREELQAVRESHPNVKAMSCARVEWAYWYFLASWMGRNGTAGTARIDYQIAVRWTKSGGSPTVRFRNAVESIPDWHRRLLNVVILKRDAFQILDRFEDCRGTAIYCDPPYALSTRNAGQGDSGSGKYRHDFHDAAGGLFDDDHIHLAEILRRYREARVVVSYYDSPRIRSLYPGWTVIEKTRVKHLHAQNKRGAPPKVAPEILLINGPSLATAN